MYTEESTTDRETSQKDAERGGQIWNRHWFWTLPAWLNLFITSLLASFYAGSVPSR